MEPSSEPRRLGQSQMSLRLFYYTAPWLEKACLRAASAREGRRLTVRAPLGTPYSSGAARGRLGRPPGGRQGPAWPRESCVRGTACGGSRVNPTHDRISVTFAPLPIALAGLRDARDSLGWTAPARPPTLSVKIFSVSPRISICGRANMAFWLKRQTARTFPEAWTRHFSAGIRVRHTVPMAPGIGPR